MKQHQSLLILAAVLGFAVATGGCGSSLPAGASSGSPGEGVPSAAVPPPMPDALSDMPDAEDDPDRDLDEQRENAGTKTNPSAKEPASDDRSWQPGSRAEVLEPVYRDRTYDPNIRTVRLFPAGRPLDIPLINLDRGETLILRFDELGRSTGNFRVRLIHCDARWTPSSIEPYQYMGSFDVADITDYAFSFNTFTPFVQYNYRFPNNDLRPTLSGNYLLVVFRDEEPDRPVISRRLHVLASQTTITGTMSRPRRSAYTDTHQRIDFTVGTERLQVRNPFEDIAVVVQQNGRWDNAMTELQPLFVRDQELVYQQEDQVFSAGKEYRFFDIQSLRFASERVKGINNEARPVEVFLVLDPINSYKRYFYRADANGRFFVGNEERPQGELEADYARVFFTLPYPYPLDDGKLYIGGALTDWDFRPENEMTYNEELRAYQGELLLKQGYYNYNYLFVENGSSTGETGLVEGDWHEAENNYQIFVYMRDAQLGYDRLVGFAQFNSLRR